MIDLLAWFLGVFTGFLLSKFITKNGLDLCKQMIVEWRDDIFCKKVKKK